MTDDPIVNQVIERIQKRSAAGMKKYGKSMTRDDRTMTDWIDEAIEEALDLAVYLTRVKADLMDLEELKDLACAEGYEHGYDAGQERVKSDWQDGYDEGYEDAKDKSND